MRGRLVLLALALGGPVQAQPPCPFAAQRQGVTVQLYFGQGPSGEPAWRNFVANVLSRAFPDGFTVYEASGQWRDPATGRVSRDRTKVIEAFLLEPETSRAAIEQAIAAFKRRFHQKSVGLLTSPRCGAF